jgi:hypothetical protein
MVWRMPFYHRAPWPRQALQARQLTLFGHFTSETVHIRLDDRRTLHDIKMVAVQGDAPVAIGLPGEQRLGEVPDQLLRRVQPALGGAQNLHGNRRVPPLLLQALMRRGVVGLDKGLVALLKL